VGHFEAKFQVQGLPGTLAQITIDRKIEGLYCNFAAGSLHTKNFIVLCSSASTYLLIVYISFHAKKLCSRLYSIEVEFYLKKKQKIAF